MIWYTLIKAGIDFGRKSAAQRKDINSLKFTIRKHETLYEQQKPVHESYINEISYYNHDDIIIGCGWLFIGTGRSLPQTQLKKYKNLKYIRKIYNQNSENRIRKINSKRCNRLAKYLVFKFNEETVMRFLSSFIQHSSL